MIRLPQGAIAVTRQELAALLYEVKGAKPVTIVARTSPSLVGGKSCPYAGATKLSRVNGIINFSYENAVNRELQRAAEDDEVVEYFEPEPRKWGTRLYSEDRLQSGKNRMLPLVAKNAPEPCVAFRDIKDTPSDELYLELKVEKSLDTQYELNGAIVPNEDIKPHLRKSSSTYNVILRDYRFDNLEEIVMDGTVYIVATQVPEPAALRESRKEEFAAV
jgi:hypothetical protein